MNDDYTPHQQEVISTLADHWASVSVTDMGEYLLLGCYRVSPREDDLDPPAPAVTVRAYPEAELDQTFHGQ